MIQPSASSIKEERYGGLTVLTLSQTFTNDTAEQVQGYYHIPLPNPAALISYQVSSNKSSSQLSDPQQLSLDGGESITYTVRYEMSSDLLVGFHQTSEPGFEQNLSQTNFAQK